MYVSCFLMHSATPCLFWGLGALKFFMFVIINIYIFSIYIECVNHIDVVLKVNTLAKTHVWSNLLSKVFITWKEHD